MVDAFHSCFPVLASRAWRTPSTEVTKTLPFHTATPRLTRSQHGLRAARGFAWGSNLHSSLPVAASTAYTKPQVPDVYMTPSTTMGVASWPRDVPRSYAQANPSRPTFPSFIVESGEK